MMNPADFGDPLTLPVQPPAGQSFPLPCEVHQHLAYLSEMYRLVEQLYFKFGIQIHVPLRIR